MAHKTTEQASSRRSTSRKWTAEEDDILRSVLTNSGNTATLQNNFINHMLTLFDADEEPVNWVDVSKHLTGRSNKDTRRRWTKIKDDFNKGVWSRAEDNALREAVSQYGQRWALVTEVVETRSPDQCQKRWRNALDPKISVASWSADDDRVLLQATLSMGKNWSKISDQHFPHRSPLSLSNRHAALQQRTASAAERDCELPALSTSSTTSSSESPESPSHGIQDTAQCTDSFCDLIASPGASSTVDSSSLDLFQDWCLPWQCPSDKPLNTETFEPVTSTNPCEEFMGVQQSSVVHDYLSGTRVATNVMNEDAATSVFPFMASFGDTAVAASTLSPAAMEPARGVEGVSRNVLVLENLDDETRDGILRYVWSKKRRTTLRLD